MAEAGAEGFSGRTAWARNLAAPARAYLQAETGGAGVLLAAAIAALVWSNVAAGSYASFWTAELSVRAGGFSVAHDVRYWVNSGLMTLFFFVVGLEARREFDMGELRERRRLALPVIAALGGMAAPVLIYLALNASSSTAGGWGTAMSTDTAFALGVLALMGGRAPQRLRIFLLTVLVVDDFVALLVIATAYTDHVALGALALAVLGLGVILAVRSAGLRHGGVAAALGVALWACVEASGVDPVVVGLVMGLLTYAYPAARVDLERATQLFRSFREQPTPELARTARMGLESAISPNERLQQRLHPWTSNVVVPLFALANAGVTVRGDELERAATSPVTLGIVVGYVLGKPLGILMASWLATRAALGGARLPVSWPYLAGGGALAGVGFTVSLLIANLAFGGEELDEAKLGVLSAAVLATLLSRLVFRGIGLLPAPVRARQLAGTAEALVDLDQPVDPDRDHVRGPVDAPVTLVEYGDFECPYCGQAETAVRELLADFGDELRYVWRHLPLSDVHQHAQLAAEASEAAAAQGRFWEMHDLLLAHQGALAPRQLLGYAEELGLEVDRVIEELRRRAHAPRIARDVESADRSGVSGTPTFFVNGQRHQGAYDLASLSRAVRAARYRARAAASVSGG